MIWGNDYLFYLLAQTYTGVITAKGTGICRVNLKRLAFRLD